MAKKEYPGSLRVTEVAGRAFECVKQQVAKLGLRKPDKATDGGPWGTDQITEFSLLLAAKYLSGELQDEMRGELLRNMSGDFLTNLAALMAGIVSSAIQQGLNPAELEWRLEPTGDGSVKLLYRAPMAVAGEVAPMREADADPLALLH